MHLFQHHTGCTTLVTDLRLHLVASVAVHTQLEADLVHQQQLQHPMTATQAAALAAVVGTPQGRDS